MSRFKVLVREVVFHTLNIEADSEDEAEEQARLIVTEDEDYTAKGEVEGRSFEVTSLDENEESTNV